MKQIYAIWKEIVYESVNHRNYNQAISLLQSDLSKAVVSKLAYHQQ